MITIDLRQEPLTIVVLLHQAETDIVRIVFDNAPDRPAPCAPALGVK